MAYFVLFSPTFLPNKCISNLFDDILLLKSGLLVDGGNGADIIRVTFQTGPHTVLTERTPTSHAPANISGLPLLMQLNLCLDDGHVLFKNLPII